MKHRDMNYKVPIPIYKVCLESIQLFNLLKNMLYGLDVTRLSNIEGSVEYPFIAITSRITLIQIGFNS